LGILLGLVLVDKDALNGVKRAEAAAAIGGALVTTKLFEDVN